MNKIYLKNNHFLVSISKIGAEILSIENTNENKQFLWSPDQIYWNRTAPNLFPIVGRLKNDEYQYNGNEFKMLQHGFARNLEFEVSKSTETSVSLILKNNETTLQQFPFEFQLEISFILNDASLDIHYNVLNLSNVEMPFSIGAHPAFAIDKPLDAYQLIFDQPFTADRYLIDQGLYTGQTETAIENSNVLNLNSQLIENDAVVFKKPPFYSVTLAEIDGNKLVTVSSSDFHYWGFWSKPGAPFFCIEPWAGLADTTSADGNLFNKEGIHVLQPNEFSRFSYSVEFH